MLIRIGYDIQFDIPSTTPFVGMVSVHPSRFHDLREPDELNVEPALPVNYYVDSFGNRCTRFLAPQGSIRLFSSSLIEDSGAPDPIEPQARVRTAPMPTWVKVAIDAWASPAGVTEGYVFRSVNRADRITGER